MELSDKKIKDILNSDTEEITVPAWDSFAGNVRKQNFMQFGLRHFNIYSIIIFAFLGSGLTYLAISNLNTNSNTIDEPLIENIIQTPIEDLSNTIDESTQLTKVDATKDVEVKSVEKKENKEILPIKTSIERPKEQPKIEENVEPEEIVDNTPVILEDSINENIDTPEIARPTYKGKTVILFETDTVIEFDTVVVDKKIKKR